MRTALLERARESADRIVLLAEDRMDAPAFERGHRAPDLARGIQDLVRCRQLAADGGEIRESQAVLPMDGGSLVLRRTTIEAPLATEPATVPTGATNDIEEPTLPAGTIHGDEFDLSDLASTDVYVEAP